MNDWILLILTLPTANTKLRMRAWRALKNAGAAVLRDGVYLLPYATRHRDAMLSVASEVDEANGAAWVFEIENQLAYALTDLFDRANDYQQLLEEFRQLENDLSLLTENESMRKLRKLKKQLEAICSIDFFPGDSQLQARQYIGEISQQLLKRLSPDEPSSQDGIIKPLAIDDYQHRTWATRKHMWVDRVASAWLIKRFIDHQAKFIWLDSPADCPADALGFDFDGATFTHVKSKQSELVTFENLMFSFGLDQDKAIKSIAQLIHVLDVGGLPVAEAAGLECLLIGMRKRSNGDDELLHAAESVFNDFYLSFQQESR